MKKSFTKHILIRLFSFMWKDGGGFMLGTVYIISMLILASANFSFSLIGSLGLREITDSIITKDINGFKNGIFFISKWFGILLLVFPIFSYLFQRSVMLTTIIIKENLFKKILSLPIDHFEKRHSGDFMSRINNDVAVAEGAYSWHVMALTMSLISAVGSVSILLSVNKYLFLYAIGFGLINIVFNLAFVKPLRIISNKIQEKTSELIQRFSDIFAGAFIIRSFSLGNLIFQKFVEANMAVYNLSLKRVKYNSILAAYNYSQWWIFFLGLIMLGGYLILKDVLTFGNLMLSINMTGSLMWVFSSIGQFFTNLQSSLAGAQRIFEILDISEKDSEVGEIKTQPSLDIPKEIYNSKVCIEFNRVSFSYNGDKEVLRDISIIVPIFKKVAFVGESGSGKSTIFKLIMGFYKPQKGDISIFGRSISDYNTKELRRLIAYVSQEPYLFNSSILENIRYGNSNATDEEVIEAAKKANAHDFIVRLTEGYKTMVGEKGVLLSGGERQRIAIARAILKDAPILLLDEPTSSLDSESEEDVFKALNTLMEGRTVLIIAHRLSTIRDADIIFVIDDGSVIESGTHEGLLKLNGRYTRLYTEQFARNGVESKVPPRESYC